MRLKTLYISLTLLSISILLLGTSYIYLDGRNRLNVEKSSSSSEINNSLLFISFVSKYKTFIQASLLGKYALDKGHTDYTEAKNKLVRNMGNLNIFDFEIVAKHVEQILKLGRIQTQIDKQVRIEKSILDESWLSVEHYLSELITKRMREGQEFLPGVKRTLGKWSKNIPFLDKIKESINVSYVEQEKFVELKTIISFSSWLVDYKNTFDKGKISNSTFEDATHKKLEALSINDANKKDIREELNKFIKFKEKLDIKKMAKSNNLTKLEEEIKSARKYLSDSLIPRWQEYISERTDKSIIERSNRHQRIVIAASVMTVFVILVMSFIFLSLFPQLNTLEKKAKRIGQGDFSVNEDEKLSNNEIGQVTKTFNRMAKELTIYMNEVKNHEKDKIHLIDSIQRMKRINELGEFSAKMAHELKNPLSILTFCLTDAAEALKDGDDEKCLNELEKSTQALERLKIISNKLGARNSNSKLELIAIDEIVGQLEGMYSSILSKNEIQLKTQMQKSAAVIYASKLELMGAISNIIDNAIEYLNFNSSSERIINIKVFKDDSFAGLIVSNEGEVIKDSDKIFQSMYSHKNSITRGMGLTIAKDIIESLNGDISYFHEERKNHFVLKIPIYKDSIEPA